MHKNRDTRTYLSWDLQGHNSNHEFGCTSSSKTTYYSISFHLIWFLFRNFLSNTNDWESDFWSFNGVSFQYNFKWQRFLIFSSEFPTGSILLVICFCYCWSLSQTYLFFLLKEELKNAHEKENHREISIWCGCEKCVTFVAEGFEMLFSFLPWVWGVWVWMWLNYCIFFVCPSRRDIVTLSITH